MNRKDLAIKAHKHAREKGFWDEEFSNKHYLMLAITEISEAVEADRKGKRANPKLYDEILKSKEEQFAQLRSVAMEEQRNLWEIAFEYCIKDTLEDELADTYIRLLDLWGSFIGQTGGKAKPPKIGDLDKLVEHNKESRRIKITAEKVNTFTEFAIYVCGFLLDWTQVGIPEAFALMEAYAEKRGINLEWHINEKMAYNAQRPEKHGKAY